jgi:hypothetical protein
VNLDDLEKGALEAWLTARVRDVERSTWAEIAEQLGRLGYRGVSRTIGPDIPHIVPVVQPAAKVGRRPHRVMRVLCLSRWCADDGPVMLDAWLRRVPWGGYVRTPPPAACRWRGNDFAG